MSELKLISHVADAQTEWRDAIPYLPAVSQGPIRGKRINRLNKRWIVSLEKTFGLRLSQG